MDILVNVNHHSGPIRRLGHFLLRRNFGCCVWSGFERPPRPFFPPQTPLLGLCLTVSAQGCQISHLPHLLHEVRCRRCTSWKPHRSLNPLFRFHVANGGCGERCGRQLGISLKIPVAIQSISWETRESPDIKKTQTARTVGNAAACANNAFIFSLPVWAFVFCHFLHRAVCFSIPFSFLSLPCKCFCL